MDAATSGHAAALWVGLHLILLLVLVLAIITAHYSRFGNAVYAIGGDRQSAELMGVPIAQRAGK